jgi:hypothetical protein
MRLEGMESLILPRLSGGEARIDVLEVHAHVNAAHLESIGFSPSARADTEMPCAFLKCPSGIVEKLVTGCRKNPTPKSNRTVLGIKQAKPHRHASDSHGQRTGNNLKRKSFHRATPLRCAPVQAATGRSSGSDYPQGPALARQVSLLPELPGRRLPCLGGTACFSS